MIYGAREAARAKTVRGWALQVEGDVGDRWVRRRALVGERGTRSTPSTWVKLGGHAVDEVRRRVQQETLGHRGRARDRLYEMSGCFLGRNAGDPTTHR